MTDLRGAGDLEAYLAQLRREGQLDSSGQFSVTGAKFFEKFGELAQVHAIRWVFFATQAAVAMGASGCRLSVSQDTVSVAWEVDPSPAWCEDGAALATFSERHVSDPAYALLRQSLLWSLSQKPLYLSLLKEGPQAGFVIECGLQDQKYKPLPPRPGRRTQFSLVFEPNRQDRRFRRPEVRSAFQAEASFRLAFCPMRVFFDGKELSEGRLQNLSVQRRGLPTRTFYHLVLERPGLDNLAVAVPSVQPAQTYYVGNGRPAFHVPSDTRGAAQTTHFALTSEERHALSLLQSPADSPRLDDELLLTEFPSPTGRQRLSARVPWTFDFGRPDFERVRARALIAHTQVRGSTLLVSHHGMLLDPVPLPDPGGPGWVAVIATDKMPCDASAARPVEGPELAHLKHWVHDQQVYWRGRAEGGWTP